MSAWMNFYTLTHNYCPWKSHFQHLLLYLPLWWISLGAGKWSSRTGSRCHRGRQWQTSTWCCWGFGTGTRSAGEWTSSSSCRQLSQAWATPRNGGLQGRTLHREVRTWSLLPFFRHVHSAAASGKASAQTNLPFSLLQLECCWSDIAWKEESHRDFQQREHIQCTWRNLYDQI